MNIGNIIDDMISLETSLSSLYMFFSELFPKHSKFWLQLSIEENGHAKLLENYKNVLPIEFQKISKKDVLKTGEDIRDCLRKYEINNPSLQEALNFSYLIENNTGEIHYQALLDSQSSAERITVFQVLNFGDKDHAKRIKDYLNNIE